MVDSVIQYFVLPVLSVCIAMVFVRLFRGPRLPDRVIALDLLVTVSIGVIAAFAMLYDEPSFLDTSFILALLAFLSTVAFAYYYEKRGKR